MYRLNPPVIGPAYFHFRFIIKERLNSGDHQFHRHQQNKHQQNKQQQNKQQQNKHQQNKQQQNKQQQNKHQQNKHQQNKHQQNKQQQNKHQQNKQQQNKQSPFILTEFPEHKKITCDIGNPGPGLRQVHTHGGVKPVNGTTTHPS
jgi:acetyl/propionyl-CoA carboxylase alpha subunit